MNDNNFKKEKEVKSLIAMALNPEILSNLKRLGLNQYEAQAYYALTRTGKSSAGKLSGLASIPRPRAYDILKKLVEKGFVAEQAGRPAMYKALKINEAVETLKKQRAKKHLKELEEIKNIGELLKSKLTNNIAEKEASGENVWVLKGREAIHSKIAAMVENAKKHIIFSTTPENLDEKYRIHSALLKKAKKRGVKIAAVCPVSKHPIEKVGKLFNKKIPGRAVLTDNQALLFLTNNKTPPEKEVGLWIQNPNIISMLRGGFPKI